MSNNIKSVSIFAPASIGNVSVGFDVLGLAVKPIDGSLLGDVVTVAATPNESSLTVIGDFADKLPSNKEDNISEDIWPLVEQHDNADYEFSDHLENQQIKNYLDKLPKAQRDVVKGVYFQDMSQEQLAEQLNIPIGTVKSRLRLALQKLRNEMGDRND